MARSRAQQPRQSPAQACGAGQLWRAFFQVDQEYRGLIFDCAKARVQGRRIVENGAERFRDDSHFSRL